MRTLRRCSPLWMTCDRPPYSLPPPNHVNRGFCFIHQIFTPSRELIIYHYNSESDIRQSPWNNNFPFAHDTLIIHIFSTLRSSFPYFSSFFFSSFFKLLWSAQHLVRGRSCVSVCPVTMVIRRLGAPRSLLNKEETGCEIRVVGQI